MPNIQSYIRERLIIKEKKKKKGIPFIQNKNMLGFPFIQNKNMLVLKDMSVTESIYLQRLVL